MARHRIYLLTDPRDPLRGYIGQTVHPVRVRYRAHINNARRGHRYPVYHWLRDILAAALVPNILVFRTCATRSDADRAECEAIAEARAAGMVLFNATNGGEGPIGGPTHGEAVRLAFRRPEVRERHQNAVIGRGAETWRDPGIRARRLRGLRAKDRCERHSAAMQRKWAEPGYRDRVGAAIARAYASNDAREAQRLRAQQVNARPDVKQRISQSMKEAWSDPTRREARLKAMRAGMATPEAKARRSAASKARWAKVRACNDGTPSEIATDALHRKKGGA